MVRGALIDITYIVGGGNGLSFELNLINYFLTHQAELPNDKWGQQHQYYLVVNRGFFFFPEKNPIPNRNSRFFNNFGSMPRRLELKTSIPFKALLRCSGCLRLPHC